MPVTTDQARSLVEHRSAVLDEDGERLGLLAQIYVDEDTEEPLWAAVVFAEPSLVETVVPVHDAEVVGDDIQVSYPREVVESAPRVQAGDELPWVEEERLRLHYGKHAPIGDIAVIVPVVDLD